MLNTIEIYDKIREGFKVKHKTYLKEYDYIAWSMGEGCICGYKNNEIYSTEIDIPIDDLYECNWEVIS